MRVIIVADMYPTAEHPSAGNFIHRQAVELVRQGSDVSVVRPVPSREPKDWRGLSRRQEARVVTRTLDGIRVEEVKYFAWPQFLSPRYSAIQLTRAVAPHLRREVESAFEPAIVHAHRLYPIAAATLRVALSSGAGFICTARGSDVHTHPERSRRIRRMTRDTLARAPRVLAVSQALALEAADLEPAAQPVGVVYNGVDVDPDPSAGPAAALRSELGLPTEGFGIVSVGRLVPGKGFTDLLDAYAAVAKEFSDAWLALVGGGPEMSSLRRAALAHGVADRLFLPGPVLPGEVRRWIRAGDVFALATHREGIPNVLYEAMACSRPVLATAVGGIPEVAKDGVTAILVQPGSSDQLREGLDRLALDETLRMSMGSEGYRRVRDHFSWAESARQLTDVYRSETERMQREA